MHPFLSQIHMKRRRNRYLGSGYVCGVNFTVARTRQFRPNSSSGSDNYPCPHKRCTQIQSGKLWGEKEGMQQRQRKHSSSTAAAATTASARARVGGWGGSRGGHGTDTSEGTARDAPYWASTLDM